MYAKWFFHAITALGWHPLLRLKRQGQYCPADHTVFRPLSQVLTTTGQRWAGAVRCFATKERQLTCTRLARWDKGYKDPWLLVTDLPAERADVAWYGLRAWIEASYKDAKRGGWHWEQTKMTHPRRAERLWLAMAVAMLWVISVGCQAEATLPIPDLDALPVTHSACQKTHGVYRAGDGDAAANMTVVRRFFDEVCNTRRLDVAQALFVPGHHYHDPSIPGIADGPAGIVQPDGPVRPSQGAFSDAHWHVGDVIADGNIVVTRWHGTGTQDGDLPGIPAVGGKVYVPGMWWQRLAAGKIVESWQVWDTLGMLQQLGAIPAPAPSEAV